MRHVLKGIPYLIGFPVLAFAVTGILALVLMRFEVPMYDALLSPFWLPILTLVSFGMFAGCYKWVCEFLQTTR